MNGFNGKQGVIIAVAPDGVTVKFGEKEQAKFAQPMYLKKLGAVPNQTPVPGMQESDKEEAFQRDIARKGQKCPECGAKEQDRYEDGDTYCKKCGTLIGATPKSKKSQLEEDFAKLAGLNEDSKKKKDLEAGMDVRGDDALFIKEKHIHGWNLDKEAKEVVRGIDFPVFFRVIAEDGTQLSGHGYIENGKIVQWG
jgi:ribosomal protein L37AE/L43A